MATRVTREQLDVGYTPDSNIRVTRIVTEVLQSTTAGTPPSSSIGTIVIVSAS